MIVKCIVNDISSVKPKDAKDRLHGWANSEGKYNDLNIGEEYAVQAVENLENGLFYYLHTVDVSEHPYPYPSELFVIEDSFLSIEWEASFRVDDGRTKIKRITFSRWAKDDLFFEKLVEGDAECVSEYLRNKDKL